jgi:hypothetical protein
LTFPPTPADSEKLADQYISKELGELVVRRGDAPMFDSGAWVSPVASRKNDDGTLSFVTVNSDISGLEFVVSNNNGKKSLITRDAQHEYVFTEPH